MASGDFEDLTRGTVSNKILHNKAFNITTNPKFDEYQKDLALMFYKVIDKKTFGSSIKNEIISNNILAEELHKPIFRNFNKR